MTRVQEMRCAFVAHHRNPFHPGMDVVSSHARVGRRLRGLAPKTQQPFVCLLNGRAMLRSGWNYRVKNRDCVQFVILPQGGDEGGSNPMAIVLTLALMAFAPWAAGAMGFAAGTLSFTLAQAAIGLVGSMLINALLPPSKANSAQQATTAVAASPTYSIGAQGNAARLGQPIPVQYGRVKAYADLGSDAYVEYAANEQYLYQLLVIGQGQYDIESINLTDTPIHSGTFPSGQFTANGSFPDITVEVIQPHGEVTLFPANVTTSAEVTGQELLTSTTVGPFVANNAGTLANYIGVDLVATSGLYYANDDGSMASKSITVLVEAQGVDAVGAPIGAWFTLGTETMTAATPTPQRHSYRYQGFSGRFQVRCTRTDTKDTSTRAGHTVAWSALRAYMPDTQDYGDITMVALRMRASNNLSSTSARSLNVICTRKLPTWNPTTGWSSAVATRSIAWAFADAVRADYGGKYVDSLIDLNAMYALDTTWSARGDHFDGRFDQKIVVWEAMTQIARAGRAKPYMQSGVVRIFRDGPATLPVAMFNMRNIVRGSFSVDYLMPTEETSDAVEVMYMDENLWTEVPVVAALPGSSALNPAQVKLFGVTSREHAWREGMFMAACNQYRRKLSSFSAEREALIPSLGDLIAVSHDMPRWGQSGEIVAWNDTTKVLTTSEPLTWTPSVSHYMGLRRPNGSLCGPVDVTFVDAYSVLVTTPAQIDFTLVIDGVVENPHYSFGSGDTWQKTAKVASIKPRGKGQFALETVIEDARVHTADGGTAPALPATWVLPTVPTVPVISGDLNVVIVGTVEAPLLSASWNAAAGADSYFVEQSFDEGLSPTWTRISEVTTPQISYTTHAGYQRLRVAPMGRSMGAWKEWSGTVAGGTNIEVLPAPSGVSTLATDNAIFILWSPYSYAGMAYLEVLRNVSDNSETAVVIDTAVPAVGFYSDYIGTGGLAYFYWLRAVNKKQEAGPLSASVTATTGVISVTPPPGSITHTMLAVDSVYADNINVSSLSAVSATIGTLRTADTGARMEIHDNVIKVYDSAGVMRVKIGDLSL